MTIVRVVTKRSNPGKTASLLVILYTKNAPDTAKAAIDTISDVNEKILDNIVFTP